VAMPRRTILAVLGAAVWAASTPAARAADPPKQTPFVTNESMEVPGMMLEPGRYILRLVEPRPERNVLEVFEVVQLWTGDESRLLSTLLTMPNYDRPTTDKSVFSFFERGPKQAKALRLWFAPGRNYGQEFVYPKAQAVELAKSAGRGVLAVPPEMPADIGLFAGGVQKGGAAPARPPAPAIQTLPLPFLPRPAPAKPATDEQPPQKPLASSLPGASPRASAGAGSEDPGGASRSAIQSRSRAIATTAPQAPERIAAELPRTAGYLPLAAVLGIVGIVSGILLRILALGLERR
jgi:hypothetical protein